MSHNKLIVILGQTASGKTGLSIKLAKKYHGQVVSADSRQVYKGLNLGSGKITKKEMQSIPHYLLDMASPKTVFSVARYQALATKAIKKIHKENSLPFLVGGTGFYIQSIVDGIVMPEVAPNWDLRKKLEKKTAVQLFKLLQKLDPARAVSIDAKNPRRLVRAIEIIKSTGKPVPIPLHTPVYKDVDVLQIGIKKSPEELKKAIQKRLRARLKAGMVAEVENLHKSGVSFKRLEELGLEYRFIARYLQKKLTLEEMTEKLEKEIWQFAKRQITWFKRDQRIQWVKNQKEADILVRKFLK